MFCSWLKCHLYLHCLSQCSETIKDYFRSSCSLACAKVCNRNERMCMFPFFFFFDKQELWLQDRKVIETPALPPA